jgi:HK97 family phage prohead protease
MAYDPVKAHEYYERTKKLKGRKRGRTTDPKPTRGTGRRTSQPKPTRGGPRTSQPKPVKVARLRDKKAKLGKALTETLVALSEKRRSAAKTEKKNSDGKTTAKERQASKEYREKNRGKLDSKRSKKSSGSSSSSKGSKSVSDMGVEELEARVEKIRGAIRSVNQQLSRALGQIEHSDSTADELLFDVPISRKESVKMTADFGGYATRSDVLCTDGRIILPDAFKEDDGQIVPLVYNHDRTDPTNILGYAKLENRPDGVYAHAHFNDTAHGQHAKKAVQHGDIKFLSIFANQLVERAKKVIKGNIREVSLVVAGANPGAVIDHVGFAHGDGDFQLGLDGDEAIISSGVPVELAHADTAEDSMDLQEILDTLDERQATAVNYLLSEVISREDNVQHSDEDGEELGADEDSDADQNDDADDNDADTDGDSTNDADGDEGDSSNTDGDQTGTEDEAGDNVQHDDSQEDSMTITHNVFEIGRASSRERV